MEGIGIGRLSPQPEEGVRRTHFDILTFSYSAPRRRHRRSELLGIFNQRVTVIGKAATQAGHRSANCKRRKTAGILQFLGGRDVEGDHHTYVVCNERNQPFREIPRPVGAGRVSSGHR